MSVVSCTVQTVSKLLESKTFTSDFHQVENLTRRRLASAKKLTTQTLLGVSTECEPASRPHPRRSTRMSKGRATNKSTFKSSVTILMSKFSFPIICTLLLFHSRKGMKRMVPGYFLELSFPLPVLCTSPDIVSVPCDHPPTTISKLFDHFRW